MNADGDWKAVASSPMGKQEFTLSVKTQGDTFTGSMSSTMGMLDIAAGKIEGDTLTWTAKIEKPMALTLKYTAKIDGDKITGTIKAGLFGGGSFEGVRAVAIGERVV